ncbi:kinase-like domain-containing protein [Hypoxylon sp. FL1857]|nr:kinase-like domain-containing protein [Hypoxylon sp. FL1857]
MPGRPRKSQIQTIQNYFNSDRRFTLEGFHGQGGQGSVYKVKFTPPGGNGLGRALVMKIADPLRNSDVQGLTREKEILWMLRNCRHIAHMHESTTEDPLHPAAGDLGWAWIYLDRLDNGTLNNFLLRVKEAGVTRLPNRLLWVLFLCLIRGCIAMAWPSDNPEMNETTRGHPPPPPSGIAHFDLHGENVMFGHFIDHPEHSLTPILTMIDFGLALRVTSRIPPTGEQQNIEDIGILMAGIISLETNKKYSGGEIEVDLSRFGYMDLVLSPAAGILGDREVGEPDPYPYVDGDLRYIISACMATEPTDRPSLAQLEEWATEKVYKGQPTDYLNDVAWETDQNIRTIVQNCIFNAP